MQGKPVEITLIASPLQLSMAERHGFRVGIAATSHASRVVDPQLHRLRLVVNGEESMAWNDTIGNGRREDKWFALPPGETVSMTWSSMGERLFDAPGSYTLELCRDKERLAVIEVRVLDDAR